MRSTLIPCRSEVEATAKRNCERIEGLRSRHQGAQCVVLCTGPSVSNVDLLKLERHPFVMGVNGAYLLRNQFRYYFASNPSYVAQNAARIACVEADYFFVRSCTAPACVKAGIAEERLIFFDGSIGEITAEVSTNLTRSLPAGPTVLLTIALPALVWCGFTEILLLGADFPHHGYRRFHTGREDAPRQLEKPLVIYETEMEVARFRASLWPEHLRRHHPSVRIINCSASSELEVFERADLASVLR
jgi:hypothetical protein